MIGRSGERESGISVLAARHDEDDDIRIYAILNKTRKQRTTKRLLYGHSRPISQPIQVK